MLNNLQTQKSLMNSDINKKSVYDLISYLPQRIKVIFYFSFFCVCVKFYFKELLRTTYKGFYSVYLFVVDCELLQIIISNQVLVYIQLKDVK